VPGLKLGVLEGVGQREKGQAMLHHSERLHRLSGHALGRRVRRDELGEALLDLFELPHQPVILGVADLGAVEDVVAVVVIADLGAQLLGPEAGVEKLLLLFLLGHAMAIWWRREPRQCAAQITIVDNALLVDYDLAAFVPR
jgi:hypothetical protein